MATSTVVGYDGYSWNRAEKVHAPNCLTILLAISILLLLYSVEHWRSTAICAAVLELPNLNYVHGHNWL